MIQLPLAVEMHWATFMGIWPRLRSRCLQVTELEQRKKVAEMLEGFATELNDLIKKLKGE